MATVGVAAPALAATAAKPEKGKTYSGNINKSTTKLPISFKVSKTGKSVSKFKLSDGPPFYCQGGGFATKSASAQISAKGSFTANLEIYFIPTKKKMGTLKLTGKFARGGKEKGMAITQGFKIKSCDGKSPYSTKAG